MGKGEGQEDKTQSPPARHPLCADLYVIDLILPFCKFSFHIPLSMVIKSELKFESSSRHPPNKCTTPTWREGIIDDPFAFEHHPLLLALKFLELMMSPNSYREAL